jgi:hypothetical protein
MALAAGGVWLDKASNLLLFGPLDAANATAVMAAGFLWSLTGPTPDGIAQRS